MSVFTFEKIEFLDSQKIRFVFKFKKFYYRRTYEFEESFDWNSSFIQNVLVNLGLSIIFAQAQNIPCRKILIKTGGLDNQQVNFWRDFMINISGQKYFLEKKKFNELPNKIITEGPKFFRQSFSVKNKLLLGMGSGKESLSTEGIFLRVGVNFDEIIVGSKDFFIKRQNKVKHSLSLGKKVFKVLSSIEKEEIFKSTTPVAVPIVFRVVLISLLFCYKYGYKNIVIATERSSNYGNIKWDGIIANHQYDKTSIFLEKVNDYIHRYITPSVDYFSSLEGLYEYKIAQVFSKFPKYLDYIISCNFATVEKHWCVDCYKCAFTYLLLCAFFDQKKIKKIVGVDLFDRLDLFKPLMEIEAVKPFECVGTKEEAWLALVRCIRKGYKGIVLEHFKKFIYPKIEGKINKLEDRYNKVHSHHIPNKIWRKIKKLYG